MTNEALRWLAVVAFIFLVAVLSGCSLPHYMDNGCVLRGNLNGTMTVSDCHEGKFVHFIEKDGRIVGVMPVDLN